MIADLHPMLQIAMRWTEVSNLSHLWSILPQIAVTGASGPRAPRGKVLLLRRCEAIMLQPQGGEFHGCDTLSKLGRRQQDLLLVKRTALLRRPYDGGCHQSECQIHDISWTCFRSALADQPSLSQQVDLLSIGKGVLGQMRTDLGLRSGDALETG